MELVMLAFPILFLSFTFFFFYISLKVLIRKKPAIINSNILSLMITLGISPALVVSLLNYNILLSVVWILIIILYLFTLRGYSIYGVNDEDFRKAVIVGLKELSIEHQEKMNKIVLPAIQNEINVAFHSWIGSGIIKLKNKKDVDLFRKLINTTSLYFKKTKLIRKES